MRVVQTSGEAMDFTLLDVSTALIRNTIVSSCEFAELLRRTHPEWNPLGGVRHFNPGLWRHFASGVQGNISRVLPLA